MNKADFITVVGRISGNDTNVADGMAKLFLGKVTNCPGGGDSGGFDARSFPCGPNYHSLFRGPNDPKVAGGVSGVDIPGFDSIKIKQDTLKALIANNSITVTLNPSAFANRDGVGDIKYLSVNLMYEAVPEPSLAVLIVMGVMSMFGAVRLRNH